MGEKALVFLVFARSECNVDPISVNRHAEFHSKGGLSSRRRLVVSRTAPFVGGQLSLVLGARVIRDTVIVL